MSEFVFQSGFPFDKPTNLTPQPLLLQSLFSLQDFGGFCKTYPQAYPQAGCSSGVGFGDDRAQTI